MYSTTFILCVNLCLMDHLIAMHVVCMASNSVYAGVAQVNQLPIQLMYATDNVINSQ